MSKPKILRVLPPKIKEVKLLEKEKVTDLEDEDYWGDLSEDHAPVYHKLEEEIHHRFESPSPEENIAPMHFAEKEIEEEKLEEGEPWPKKEKKSK